MPPRWSFLVPSVSGNLEVHEQKAVHERGMGPEYLPGEYKSFITTFHGPIPRDDHHFHLMVGFQLAKLVDLDATTETGTQSLDPTSPEFAFWVANTDFFVIGLHPWAADPARHFDSPALVFNAHSQFRGLREKGAFEKIKAKIRGKDALIHPDGKPNPCMSNHGEASEISQYTCLRDQETITAFFPKQISTLFDGLED
jgi:FPC/CPF motif-containing protein YcgG